ncbi:MAG: tetratricopeptide repeat protein, partial [Bdellovibrionales bacterium]
MYHLKTLMSVVTASLTLVACSTLKSSREFSYHDSALDDRNRAPAALMPPATFSEQGTKIDPAYNQSQADFNYSMGEAASLEGSPQKAIEFFKSALIYDSNATSVKLRLASEQLRIGQLSEALALTQEVVREKPQDQQGLLLMAALYSSLKLYPKAIDYYQKVLVLNPENEDANLYLGALYAETKQFEKAVQHFEKMLARTEDQE